MKERIKAIALIGGLLLIIAVMCINIFGKENKKETVSEETTTAAATVTPVTSPVITTLPPVTTTLPVVTEETTEVNTVPTVSLPAVEENQKPETVKEIIDKYTELVDSFKKNKPAYKKKEFQALPEEHRNFGGAVNFILNIASRYMVSEEDCVELVRPAQFADIIWDMPIHNSEKGCALTDYDAVSWAKCEDMGDGTYKISFSLKEEVNAEPTPVDTLTPVSAHGAVMQPVAMGDIMKEVENVTSSLPGITLNDFSLYYRDCEFICVYDAEADEVLSITHHIVIDISADIKLFGAQIDGTARLLNEMFIYDITW